MWTRCILKDNFVGGKIPLKSDVIQTVQFSSVAQSCPTLWDPMDCSMPGLPVHHQLPEFIQTCPLSWWCHPTISSSVVPFSSCLQSFPASGSFQMSQFFASRGQSIGVSASTSVLPVNTQDWFPLGWTNYSPTNYIRKLSARELMLLNCGVGEDSWESLGQQRDPTSPS